ncbi:hypothetical protein VTJ04DRAFT_2018 [Mycothermus thermophilus]|uniref:uncharacterized protein n=1 Tax=Humicola insolens TaxID=85995 RepID=UPI00374492B3
MPPPGTPTFIPGTFIPFNPASVVAFLDINPSAPGYNSPSRGLEQAIYKPFTHLSHGTWLLNRPPTDVYCILIDAFRLRLDDEAVWEHRPGGHNPIPVRHEVTESKELAELEEKIHTTELVQRFQVFLRILTDFQPLLLPDWWDESHQNACEGMILGEADLWYDIRLPVTRADVVEYYHDFKFAMQLRIFAAQVHQTGPGERDWTQVLEEMVALEQDETPQGVCALLQRQEWPEDRDMFWQDYERIYGNRQMW